MFNDISFKKFFKSKTILFSAILAILGAVELNLSLLRGIFSEDVYGVLMMVVSACVAVLRVITTQALKDK